MADFHRFKLGELNCIALSDSKRNWTIFEAFPGVPREELQAEIDQSQYPIDIDRHGNVLLVEAGGQKILIDSGLPTARGGELVESLKLAGIDPAEIDLLAITHGDGDHIGGLANYPNARFILPKNSWNLWTEGVDGMVEEFLKLFQDTVSAEQLAGMKNGRLKYPSLLPELKDRIDLVELDEEFAPGIKFVAAPGHRSDHAAVEIQSGSELLLHIVDAFRHPIQTKRPEWTSLFDSYPEQTTYTARRLMQRAVETEAVVFGAHFSFPGLIRLTQNGTDIEWKEL